MAGAPIVVYPPDEDGGRRVRARGAILGRAYSPADLLEFLRRAGLDPDDVNLHDPGLIEWRGGGPDAWSSGDGRPLPAQRGQGQLHDQLRHSHQQRPPAPHTCTFLVHRLLLDDPEGEP